MNVYVSAWFTYLIRVDFVNHVSHSMHSGDFYDQNKGRLSMMKAINRLRITCGELLKLISGQLFQFFAMIDKQCGN